MELYGKLDMNDDGEFELHNETGIINISKMLDGIYESQLKPLVYIKIEKEGHLLIEEDGGLLLHTDSQKVESYFVCGINISKELFYNTDEFLSITIKKGNKDNNGNKS